MGLIGENPSSFSDSCSVAVIEIPSCSWNSILSKEEALYSKLAHVSGRSLMCLKAGTRNQVSIWKLPCQMSKIVENMPGNVCWGGEGRGKYKRLCSLVLVHEDAPSVPSVLLPVTGCWSTHHDCHITALNAWAFSCVLFWEWKAFLKYLFWYTVTFFHLLFFLC